MNSTVSNRQLAAALIVAVGLTLSGWFVGNGFYKSRLGNRFVTVKGVSEKEVEADLALWPLRFTAASNDLGKAQGQIDKNIAKTLEFLDSRGVDTSQAERQGLRVNDAMADPYRSGPISSRFTVTETLMVRSSDPVTVLEAGQQIGELVNAGVVVSSGQEYQGGGPTFLFTRLNDLKPEMIAEATARAREAAEQFAADSGSDLQGIRQANQGVFVILPRDQAPGIMEHTQLNKTVRVVSTIQYYLAE